MGAGLFGGLINNAIAPSIDRMTGTSAGTFAGGLVNNMINPGAGQQSMEQGARGLAGQLFGTGQDSLGQGMFGQAIQPGYQMPTPQQPQQGPSQYYQQMRESMQGMDKALKELEGLQTPGGQYQGGGFNDFARIGGKL